MEEVLREREGKGFMDNHWSDFIQTTEELYISRAVRFHEGNKDVWLDKIGVAPGMDVLEIGCGGGLFCHRLKQFVPDIRITGVDFDENHISFAQQKAEELGLDCTFTAGDISQLPFENETFDLVYSHTVAEHIPPDVFYGEQKRVLKPGGRLTALMVRTRLNIKDSTMNEFGVEEEKLQEKLWSQVEDVTEQYEIGKYERDEHEFPKELERHGFHDIEVSLFSVIDYAPDNASVSEEEALRQIESHRVASLASVQKAFRLAPEALKEGEKNRLVELIHGRYDERIRDYRNGVRRWDFSTTSVLAVSGVK